MSISELEYVVTERGETDGVAFTNELLVTGRAVCGVSACGSTATVFIIEHVDTANYSKRAVMPYCGEHYYETVRRYAAL